MKARSNDWYKNGWSLDVKGQSWTEHTKEHTEEFIGDARIEARKENLTAEFILSRTAISKWESGRGYPSIDSLKAISEYFAISIDDLLSGKELILAAEQDNRQKILRMQDIVFGLLDAVS